MTTKEKLEKALEALEYIAEGKCETVGSDEMYAAVVHANLTTPRTETVEVKMWKCRDCGHAWDYMPMICPYTSEDYCCNGRNFIELTGTYTRPIPEPETWEGEVLDVGRDGFVVRVRCNNAPESGLSGGKRVIVEVCE